jgi:hypothetical protein
MRSFSILLFVYLSCLVMPSLGYAACLLSLVDRGWRAWGWMRSPDFVIQADLAQDLGMLGGIFGEVVSVQEQGRSGASK